MERQRKDKIPSCKLRAMPFKVGASFKKLKIGENTQVELPNLPRKLDNVVPLCKGMKFTKVRVEKGAEEKKEDDVVSLRGDLEKANEALEKAQKEMGVVT